MDAVRAGSGPLSLAALAAVAAFAQQAPSPIVLASRAALDQPVHVVLAAGSHAALVAYRDDTAAASWQVLDRDGDRYVVDHPAARFTVVVVCAKRRAEIRAWQLVAGDASTITTDCDNDARARTPIEVRFAGGARFARAGDRHAAADRDGGPSELALPAGRFDWIASDGARQISIVRDVPSTIGRITVDLRGAHPPDEIAVDAPGAREVFSLFVSRTGTKLVELPNARRGVLQIFPRALTAPGDRHELVANRWLGGHAWSRVISAVAIPGSSIRFDLPSSVPPVVDEGDTVQWFGAGDAGAIVLFRGNQTAFWDIAVSRRWLSGRTSYTFDLSDLPGYDHLPPPEPGWGVGWHWSSDPRSLPLDNDPPIGVTYRSAWMDTDPTSNHGSGELGSRFGAP